MQNYLWLNSCEKKLSLYGLISNFVNLYLVDTFKKAFYVFQLWYLLMEGGLGSAFHHCMCLTSLLNRDEKGRESVYPRSSNTQCSQTLLLSCLLLFLVSYFKIQDHVPFTPGTFLFLIEPVQ